MEIDVPVVLFARKPTFFTKAIAASASGACARWSAAARRVVRKRARARFAPRCDLTIMRSDVLVTIFPADRRQMGASKPRRAARPKGTRPNTADTLAASRSSVPWSQIAVHVGEAGHRGLS